MSIPCENIPEFWLPNVLNQLILEYLPYIDYSDKEIRSFFPLSTVLIWRKASKVKDGMANGVKHSVDDLPMIKGSSRMWYTNGNLHRDDDLPAFVYSNRQEWYKDGKLHRENDLPAVISIVGDRKEWYINGKLHRENDMPAIIKDKGKTHVWYKNGLPHRDGNLPAYISNDVKQWYKDGVFRYSERIK